VEVKHNSFLIWVLHEVSASGFGRLIRVNPSVYANVEGWVGHSSSMDILEENKVSCHFVE
jgi:hypothetical protein